MKIPRSVARASCATSTTLKPEAPSRRVDGPPMIVICPVTTSGPVVNWYEQDAARMRVPLPSRSASVIARDKAGVEQGTRISPPDALGAALLAGAADFDWLQPASSTVSTTNGRRLPIAHLPLSMRPVSRTAELVSIKAPRICDEENHQVSQTPVDGTDVGVKWAIQDSNLGPLPYQRSALTD